MSNVFQKVQVRTPDYNTFDLSHFNRFTANFSKLIPTLCQEVYPGETWSCSAQGFVRMMPLVAPMMTHVDVKNWFFFIPYRLIWSYWREFITYGVDGPDASLTPAHGIPETDITNTSSLVKNRPDLFADGSLMDYLGFPTFKQSDLSNTTPMTWSKVNLLPFIAYQMLYNEYFINRNVQTNLDSNFDVWRGFSGHLGLSSVTKYQELFKLRDVNWSMDYFTSCLPFTQRGAAVPIPVGNGEVQLVNEDLNGQASLLKPAVTNYSQAANANVGSNDNNRIINKENNDTMQIDVTKHTKGIITNVVGSINDLRFATRLQSWLEKSARVGSRYIEQLRAHFGVISSDARLQRPELLGGGSYPIVISDVEQVSSTDDVSPQGNLAGKGVGFGKSVGFKKNFDEHGYLFCITCVSPRAQYKNLWPRQFSRFNPFDFYFPEFQHLGEQEVTKRELHYDPLQGSDYNDATFGYQQRFAELRYIPNTVHGDFKNDTILSKWLMCRELGAVALNDAFVRQQCDYNSFADVSDASHHLLLEQYFDIKASRPLDYYATPTL